LNKATRTITTDYTKFFDTYVVASKSTVVIVGVENPGAEIPERFSLEQNYPNPFNPYTTIRFNVPVASQVVLKIYNVLGQEVRTLVDQRHNPGRHIVLWDGHNNKGANLSSGVYFIRMQAGKFVKVRKAALLK